MTAQELNKLVGQYEPLINKITAQMSANAKYPWAEVKSMAYEGLAIAFNTYDSERSKMTFVQFAGFAIRNNILTGLNNELRTVKLSAYAQKKAIERGEATFNSVSLDMTINDNPTQGGSNCLGGPKRSDWSNLCEEAKFSDGDIFETLYSKIEDNFAERDCEIFYRTFGLKDFEEDLEKNGYWEDVLTNYYKHGINYVTDYKAAVEAITAETVQATLKKLVEAGNMFEVVMLP